ncbi:MAG: LysM peptidoglycan-binding domain-containing protein [Ardenticatenaceae bacterium]|nr:LysM peptidoglycan-binding domain-containing protein [Ardenticatenaceae bacterium]
MLLLLLGGLIGCSTEEATIPVTATPNRKHHAAHWGGVDYQSAPHNGVLQTTPHLLPNRHPAHPIVYLIEAGDTLLDLALRYGYTVADIESLNPGIRPELLQIGQPVVLPRQQRPFLSLPTPRQYRCNCALPRRGFTAARRAVPGWWGTGERGKRSGRGGAAAN